MSELPAVVDRSTFEAERGALLVREKAHTRAGDAIAAARRRLPMTEVDASVTVTGPDGPVPLAEVFEGRGRLVAYFQMWHDDSPAADQCTGCTFFNGQVRELSDLHARDVTYATFCHGPYAESARYRDFMGWDVPWYSVRGAADALHAGRWEVLVVSYLRVGDRVFETYRTGGRGIEVMAPSLGLLDMTALGRGETWEDSPAGRPQRSPAEWMRERGRPTAQWSRLAAGRPDDLSVTPM